jgi:hypothetical protein
MDEVLYEKAAHFFAGKSNQLVLFLAIEEMMRGIGEVKVEVMKSQISFGTNYKFAWVWLPMKFGAKPHGHVRPIGSLVISFGLDRCIKHERIVAAVNPYPNRWTHHVIIENPDQLDDILLEWLKEAYNFSARPRTRAK